MCKICGHTDLFWIVKILNHQMTQCQVSPKLFSHLWNVKVPFKIQNSTIPQQANPAVSYPVLGEIKCGKPLTSARHMNWDLQKALQNILSFMKAGKLFKKKLSDPFSIFQIL